MEKLEETEVKRRVSVKTGVVIISLVVRELSFGISNFLKFLMFGASIYIHIYLYISSIYLSIFSILDGISVV